MGEQPVYIRLATQKTPEIRITFDSNRQVLNATVKGRCIPENPVEFFDPLFSKIKQKIAGLDFKEIHHNYDLEYVNSVSLKFLIKLINIFKSYESKGVRLIITWYYEDDDTYEIGRDLSLITAHEFNFVSK